MLLDRPLMVTEADLEDSIRSAEVPVVLDCYADWCGPCKATAPALAALAGQHAGRVLVLKLDTDRYPGAAQRLGIRGIPTLIAFREGRELHRHVGMASLPQLEALAGVV
jgi:thioredoxin